MIADVSLYTIYTCTRTSVLFTLNSSFIALLFQFDVKLTEVIQLDEPGAAEMQTAVSTVLATQEFRSLVIIALAKSDTLTRNQRWCRLALTLYTFNLTTSMPD